jgi:hypothetical protein
MDPYVRVIIGNQMQDSIVAKNFHKEPYWRGEMAFRCTKDQVINFEIWDKRTMGKNRLIGSCSLTLAGLADNYFFDWLPIYHKSDIAGQFLVCIHFYPTHSRYSENMSTQPMSNMMDSGYRMSGTSMNQPIGSNMGMMRSNMGSEYQTMNQGMRMRPTSYEMSPINRMSPMMMNPSRTEMGTMGSMNRMTPMQTGMDPMMSRNTGMEPMRNLGSDMFMRPMSSETGMYSSMNRMNPMNTMNEGMRPMSSEIPMLSSMNRMDPMMKPISSEMGMMSSMNQMSRNMGMETMKPMSSKMTPLSITPIMSPSRKSNMSMSTGMGSIQNLGSDMMSRTGTMPMSSEMGMMNTMNKMMPMGTPNPMSMGMNPLDKMGSMGTTNPMSMGMNPMGSMGSMGTEMEKMYLMNKMGMNPMTGSNIGSKFIGSDMGSMNKMTSEMGKMNLMGTGMGTSSGTKGGLDNVISDLERKTHPSGTKSNLMSGQDTMNVTGQMLSGQCMGGPMMTGFLKNA